MAHSATIPRITKIPDKHGSNYKNGGKIEQSFMLPPKSLCWKNVLNKQAGDQSDLCNREAVILHQNILP